MIVSVCKMNVRDSNIKNRVYNYYFDNLVKARKSETKYFNGREKHKDSVVYYTRYRHKISIRMTLFTRYIQILDYHELIGNIEELDGKKYLVVNDHITLKDNSLLTTCVIKDYGKVLSRNTFQRSIVC